MTPKVRNHLSSLCILYVKAFYHDDYKKLFNLASENYPDGTRHYTLATVFSKFLKERQVQQQIDVL